LHPEKVPDICTGYVVRRFLYKSKNTVTTENFKVQDGSRGKYQATLVNRPSSHGFYFSGYLYDKLSERDSHPKAVKET
jgi:hypothetical protein